MLAAVEAALPADVAVFAAAVADWRVAQAGEQKIKKDGSGAAEARAGGKSRHPRDRRAAASRSGPQLVIGFAAETEKVVEHAKAKLTRKGCDWIVANDVSAEAGVMGGDSNTMHLVTAAASSTGRRSRRTRSRSQLVARIAAAN